MGLAPMVVPRCSRTDDPYVGHWILNRIASSRIIDRMGYLKQSGGPLLHQMLKINHLLTLRSPNANNWRELDQPLRRDRSRCLFRRPYLLFVCQAGGSRYGCPTRSKKMFGENDLVDNLSRSLDRAREKRDTLASEVTTLTTQIAEIETRLSEEKNRRASEPALGDIELLKKRIQQQPN